VVRLEEKSNHQNDNLMTELSIIIISYNTKNVIKKCLFYLKKNFDKYPLSYQIIVVDNASLDGSVSLLKKISSQWSNLKVIFSKKNLGFVKGNNLALNYIKKSKYILFLNSDVFVKDIDFNDLLKLLEFDEKIGALTVKLLLSNQHLDLACHRGFPNLWRSFCYFSNLEKFFSKIFFLNKIFGGYHLTHLNLEEVHSVEVISGAFFLTRKEIIDKIGGFDEDYFAYGEDIEMCWQINKLGYKIIYYPLWQAIHLKSISGLKKKDNFVREETKYYFYQSMKIFYQKHFEKKHPFFLNKLVYFFIDLQKKLKGL